MTLKGRNSKYKDMKNTLKNTLKNTFTKVTLSILSFGIIAQVNFAQAQQGKDTYTSFKMSYEVDGMDVWELPEPRTAESVAEAITTFKERCSAAVPAFYQNRVSELGLNQEDFKITTNSYNFFIRGYGDSHRCRMTTEIKNKDFSFVHKKTSQYYNTREISAYEQCRSFRDGLDARANEINLFDRIIQIAWGKINGKPAIVGCFVNYTTIKF